MDFTPSPRAADLTARVREFVDSRVLPVEEELTRARLANPSTPSSRWPVPPQIRDLQRQARDQGLWNLFLPAGHEGPYAQRYGTDGGAGLTNLDYAPVAEQMGRSFIAPLVFNSNAPDTGNMEVLLKYGSQEQKDTWLDPLLDGRIRSAFLMTEPGEASSDATNMAATAVLDGDEVVLNGKKWWSTGVGSAECAVGIYMGVTDAGADKHHRHSMVLVPLDAPGVRIDRVLTSLGHYDEPLGHGEVTLANVRLPASSIIGGPGRAFEIAQGRLGPGRVHHTMRLIGLAERALDLACARAVERVAFGKPLADLGGNRERLAKARIAINQSRLHVLHAAWKLDTVGIRGALSEVSEIKAAVPQMACDVIDLAMQLHGGGGVGPDFPLAEAYAGARSLRLADGPDEVHLGVVARLLLKPYREAYSAPTRASAGTPAGTPTGASAGTPADTSTSGGAR